MLEINMIRGSRIGRLLMLGLILCCVQSQELYAQLAVPIANSSFEEGGLVSGVPAGWTLTAGNATDLGQTAGGSGGDQALWIGPDVSIRQDLNHVLVAGETLTLEYASSRGANYARKIQLYARDQTDYVLMVETTEQTGDASWPTISLNHQVASAHDGRSLTLQIVGDDSGDLDGNDWNEFDDFRITTDSVPATAYAWYRSDLGVSLGASGQVTRWATQGATAHDLDRVVGAPLMIELPRSGGGTAPALSFDGSSAVWAAAGDWGSNAGNRTVMARVRLMDSSDGFLFDGSTQTGLTRAQVRGGFWQAGVQSSSNFTAADPATVASAPNLWQTHVFEYEESSGVTTVTHWIDGNQVGSHIVSTDTNLSGLIIGANGEATGWLNMELVELMVFDRLLTPSERAELEAGFLSRWGDLNLPLVYQSSTVVQNPRTIPKFGIYELARLEVSSSGMLPGNVLTELTYDLSATTTPSDIEELRLYDSGASSSFDPQSAELLAVQNDPTGSFVLSRSISRENQYFWLVAKLRGTSSDEDVLDVAITDFSLSGSNAGDYVPAVTAPPGSLTIDAHAIYSMVLRKGGDDGSGNYRIPALVTTNAGSLIAGFDVRWNGNNISSPDLPADIDTAVMRSTDGGITWSAMQVIMDFDENVSGSSGNGVGDPSLLVDRTTGRIWCAALWSKGNNGWNGSGSGLSADDTGQFVLSHSDDDGLSWSDPISITPQIKDPNWRLYFNGPGKGITTRDGTLIFPAQYRRADGVAHSNFIFSTDNGSTWQNSPPAYVNGSEWTSESQIVELDNGSLLISMRNYVSRKQRLWNIFSWDPNTETIADGTWGTAWYQETDPTVMASVERYSSVLDGHPWSALLFSNPDSTSRQRMSIRVSLDQGQSWPYKRKIDDLPAAYSCMTILPDGDIGILYETGELSSISRLVFARFPLTWLVGTNDADLDGIPDFNEDVMGLNLNEGSDALIDSDMDGRSNRDEYLAMTDIYDKSSYFAVNGMEFTGDVARLSVETRVGRNYELQVSSSLEPNSWRSVGKRLRGNGGLQQIQYPLAKPADARQFFRIRVIAP